MTDRDQNDLAASAYDVYQTLQNACKDRSATIPLLTQLETWTGKDLLVFCASNGIRFCAKGDM